MDIKSGFSIALNEDCCVEMCFKDEIYKNVISAHFITILLEIDISYFKYFDNSLDLFNFSNIKDAEDLMKRFLRIMYFSYPIEELEKNDRNVLETKRLKWFIAFKRKLKKIFTDKNDIRRYLINKNFEFSIKIAEKNGKYQENISFHCIECFFYWALWQYTKSDIVLIKCENCGRYFFPKKRKDEKYCDRKDINGKTCKQIGYIESKLKNDEIMSNYRKIYKTQNARKQRNKNNVKKIDERFLIWHSYAKEQLRLCKSGEITETEMVQNISGDNWLRSDINA